jgi:hypothetical protein
LSKNEIKKLNGIISLGDAAKVWADFGEKK